MWESEALLLLLHTFLSTDSVGKPAPGGLAGRALPGDAHRVGHKRLGTAVYLHTACPHMAWCVCSHHDT